MAFTGTATAFKNSWGVNIHLADTASAYYTQFPQLAGILADLNCIHVRDNLFDAPGMSATYYGYQNINTLAASGIKFSLVAMDPFLLGIVYTSPVHVNTLLGYITPGAVAQGEETAVHHDVGHTQPLVPQKRFAAGVDKRAQFLVHIRVHIGGPSNGLVRSGSGRPVFIDPRLGSVLPLSGV